VGIGWCSGVTSLLTRAAQLDSLRKDANNPLSFPIVSAESTSFSYFEAEPIEKYPYIVGRQSILVGGLQVNRVS
jgi:hypothetical protein